MDRRVPPDTFAKQLRAAAARAERLKKSATGSPDHQHAVLLQTFEELSTAFEELSAAESELRSQADALAETRAEVDAERQRYRDLFEFAPDGYLVTDLAGVIREANH